MLFNIFVYMYAAIISLQGSPSPVNSGTVSHVHIKRRQGFEKNIPAVQAFTMAPSFGRKKELKHLACTLSFVTVKLFVTTV